MAIYLAPMRFDPHRPVGRGSVAAEVKRPTRGRAGHSWSPYLALLQVGFGRRCVAARGRTLLPPDFTLADAPKTRRRYVSVPLSVPGSVSRAGAWALPSTPSGGARTFLPEAQGPAAATRPVRLPPGARLARACRRVKQLPLGHAPSLRIAPLTARVSRRFVLAYV